MKLIDPYVNLEKIDGRKMMKKIEKAGRTCYKSSVLSDDSYKKFISNIIGNGHESVLEHEKVTVVIGCDVGAYKDITRHRLASFSIESTRYCNYGKDKFGNELKFIRPCNIKEGTEEYKIWERTMLEIEKSYIELSNLGAKPDQLRMLLPHSTAAELVMTCNLREWRHVFKLRCSSHAHPSIRQFFIPLLLYFREVMPEVFNDVPYDEEFPKENYAKINLVEAE